MVKRMPVIDHNGYDAPKGSTKYRLLLACWIMLGILSPGGDIDRPAAAAEMKEELDSIVEVMPGEVKGRHLLGLPTELWLRISGPVIWSLLLCGIVTRHIRIKGRAGVLLRIHKVFGYAAFILATFHGVVGLFF